MRKNMSLATKFKNQNTFSERVLKLALSIPKGRVSTYGRISLAAGGGGISAQSITSILGKAHDRGIRNIPFHRIVYANGKIWINDKYRKQRLALYKKENIRISKKDKVEDFEKKLFEFK